MTLKTRIAATRGLCRDIESDLSVIERCRNAATQEEYARNIVGRAFEIADQAYKLAAHYQIKTVGRIR